MMNVCHVALPNLAQLWWIINLDDINACNDTLLLPNINSHSSLQLSHLGKLFCHKVPCGFKVQYLFQKSALCKHSCFGVTTHGTILGQPWLNTLLCNCYGSRFHLWRQPLTKWRNHLRIFEWSSILFYFAVTNSNYLTQWDRFIGCSGLNQVCLFLVNAQSKPKKRLFFSLKWQLLLMCKSTF